MIPCAILCGGLATRLRPLTEKIPKSLVEVNGQPFIAHQLSLLRSHGIERVVLCVGHLGELIRNFVGDGSRFGLEISYSFDGESLLGTAGAIKNAIPLLGSSFFTLYGDSYLLCDYAAVSTAFEIAGQPGLMTVYRNVGRYDRSNVEFENGRIVCYDKRSSSPQMQYIDYGLGVFQSAVFDDVPEGKTAGLEDIYQRLLSAGALAAFEVSERFYEIGSPSGIADLESYLSAERLG